jgi:hypothetical protein
LNRSTKDFISYVKRIFMTELDEETPFDTAKEYKGEDGAVLPLCAKCPSKRQIELFEDFIAASDCPDSECYDAKCDAQYKLDEQKEAARKGVKSRHDLESGCDAFNDDDDDEDDDDDYQETEEDRKEREEREAKRREKNRREALQLKKKVEYYLDIKAEKGFSPSDLFWAAEDFNL